MTTAELLMATRDLVAKKWSEAPGSSVLDSFFRAKRGGCRISEAYELLEEVAVPAAAAFNAACARFASAGETRQLARAAARCSTLGTWLEQPGRTRAQVLRAFDLAILKAQSAEAA